MKKRIRFRVHGDVPPKKDGANSMWAKPVEIPRLIALRKAAHEAMRGSGPLRKNISLKLRIYCPAEALERVGDLDNFVTGVCDGLMAAHPRIKRDRCWSSSEFAYIAPDVVVAIAEDSEVRFIQAAKETTQDNSIWYQIILEGES